MAWIILGVGTAIAQESPDPVQVLSEANQYIQSAAKLYVQIEYRWYETHQSTTPVDQQQSIYLRAGDRQFTQMDGRTMNIEDQMVTLIYESGKQVFLQPLLEGLGPSLFVLPTDSLINAYQEITVAESGGDYLLTCTMDDPQYDRIEMRVDRQLKRITSATIFLTDWGEGQPRMELDCRYLPFPSEAEY